MAALQRLKRLIDRDLGGNERSLSPYVAAVPAVAGIALIEAGGRIALLLGAMLCLVAIVCEAFVIWRISRVARAANIRKARRYERHDRYALPSEYADSESACLASRRPSTPATFD